MPTWNRTIFYTCVCVKVTGYSLMDIPCTGFCPFLPRYPQLPVWHPLTWRQMPHLYQQSQMVQPLSLRMSGFAWEEKHLHFKTGPCQEKQQTHPHFFCIYLDSTLAAVDLRALTASEWRSSATAERMKPSSSVNTVTELDFLLTPRT